MNSSKTDRESSHRSTTRDLVETVETRFGEMQFLVEDSYTGEVSQDKGEDGCSALELLVAGLEPGESVLDVGCHAGFNAIALSKALGPRGEVWAIEPDPDLAALARANFAAGWAGAAIRLFEAVPSDQLSIVPYIVRRSVRRAKGARGSKQVAPPSIERIAIPLDIFNGAITPSLVRIDLGLGNIIALRGASQLLLRTRPRVFLSPADAGDAADCAATLSELGYDVYAFGADLVQAEGSRRAGGVGGPRPSGPLGLLAIDPDRHLGSLSLSLVVRAKPVFTLGDDQAASGGAVEGGNSLTFGQSGGTWLTQSVETNLHPERVWQSAWYEQRNKLRGFVSAVVQNGAGRFDPDTFGALIRHALGFLSADSVPQELSSLRHLLVQGERTLEAGLQRAQDTAQELAVLQARVQTLLIDVSELSRQKGELATRATLLESRLLEAEGTAQQAKTELTQVRETGARDAGALAVCTAEIERLRAEVAAQSEAARNLDRQLVEHQALSASLSASLVNAREHHANLVNPLQAKVHEGQARIQQLESDLAAARSQAAEAQAAVEASANTSARLKQESLDEVLGVKADLQALMTRVSEQEEVLAQLRQERDQALDKVSQGEAAVAALSEQRAAAEEALTALNQRLATLEQGRTDDRDAAQQLQASLNDANARLGDELASARAAHEAELVTLRSELAEASAAADAGADVAARLKQQSLDTIEGIQAELQALKTQVVEQEKALAQLGQERDEALEHASQCQAAVETLEEQRTAAEHALSAMNLRFATLEKATVEEREGARQAQSALKDEVARLEDELGTARTELATSEKAKSDLDETTEKLVDELAIVRSELEAAMANASDLESRVDDLTGQTKALGEANAILQTQLEALEARSSTEVSHLAASASRLEADLAAMRKDRDQLLATSKELETALALVTAEREEAVAARDSLETELASAAAKTAAEVEALTCTVVRLEAELADRGRERDEDRASVRERDATIERLTQELDAANVARQVLDGKLADLESSSSDQVASLIEAKAQLSADLAQLAGERDAARASLEELRDSVSGLTEERGHLAARMEGLVGQLETLDRAFGEERATFKAEAARLEAELAELLQDRDDAQETLQTLQGSLEVSLARLESTEDLLKVRTEELAELDRRAEAERSSASRVVESLEGVISSLRDELADVTRQYEQARSDAAATRDALASVEADGNVLTKQLAELQADRDQLRSETVALKARAEREAKRAEQQERRLQAEGAAAKADLSARLAEALSTQRELEQRLDLEVNMAGVSARRIGELQALLDQTREEYQRFQISHATSEAETSGRLDALLQDKQDLEISLDLSRSVEAELKAKLQAAERAAHESIRRMTERLLDHVPVAELEAARERIAMLSSQLQEAEARADDLETLLTLRA